MKRILAAMLIMLMLVNLVLACVAEEVGVIEEQVIEFVEEIPAAGEWESEELTVEVEDPLLELLEDSEEAEEKEETVKVPAQRDEEETADPFAALTEEQLKALENLPEEFSAENVAASMARSTDCGHIDWYVEHEGDATSERYVYVDDLTHRVTYTILARHLFCLYCDEYLDTVVLNEKVTEDTCHYWDNYDTGSDNLLVCYDCGASKTVSWPCSHKQLVMSEDGNLYCPMCEAVVVLNAEQYYCSHSNYTLHDLDHPMVSYDEWDQYDHLITESSPIYYGDYMDGTCNDCGIWIEYYNGRFTYGVTSRVADDYLYGTDFQSHTFSGGKCIQCGQTQVVNPDIEDIQVISATINESVPYAGIPFDVTVVTSSDAEYLRIEDAESGLVSGWGKSSSILSGSTRIWNVRKDVQYGGDRVLLFSASADGETFGSALSKRVYLLENPEIKSVINTALNGRTLTLSVKTGTTADKLHIYDDDSDVSLKSWAAGSYSTVSDGFRVWNVEYTFGSTGTYRILIKTSAGGKMTSRGIIISVTVTANAPAVNSVAASQMLLSNGQAQATYTVKTTANTTSVKMYSEDGTLIKTFNSSNASYSTSGSVRTWTLKYAFGNDGTRTMSFAASDGSTTSAKKACTVTLYGVQVKSAAFSPSSVKVGTAAKATIKTNSGANYLHMYSEDGNWIKTWTASSNSTVSGGVRTWNISYVFAVAGNRTMTFKASRDNANPKAGVTAKVTVTSGTASTSITSVGASTTSVTAKNTLKFTIKTPTSANYIKMYAENGGLVKTWSGNSYYTTSGSVRTWTLPYAFSNAGNRTVTFKASNSGNDLSSGKSITIKVLTIPNVTSAIASSISVTAKNTMTFTAKTPTNAYSLSLYAEDGSKVKTWNSSGNSTVSGSVRTWKVSYAFNGAGNRRVTLKASANGVQYGTGKTLAITVLPVPSVSMALFAEDTVMRGEQTSIIVMSSTNGYYLHMFLEDGTLFKTWNSSGNSAVSGNTRVWQVPYTFSGAGTRKMTFKVSANNAHYGTGKTATIVVQ